MCAHTHDLLGRRPKPSDGRAIRQELLEKAHSLKELKYERFFA
jgi:hypothetical protein